MLISQKIDIDGWTVELNFREFKPDGWFPSQPQKCATWATAELHRPAQYPSGWAPAALLRYPEQGYAAVFDSDRDGYEAAIANLTARIQAFKTR